MARLSLVETSCGSLHYSYLIGDIFMAANGSFGCRQRQCDPYFQCVHVGVISVHACTQTC